MTQIEFEKLSKQEQNFRWALFLKSNGYQRDLNQNEIEEIRIKYLVQGEKLKMK